MDRSQPFILKALDAEHTFVPFETLKISTVTAVVRLVNGANIQFADLFDYLPVVPEELQITHPNFHWPEGSITCVKHLDKVRGISPTESKRAFKNATMLWIFLKEKQVNVKVSCNTLHVTGCKNLNQVADTCRLLQLHLDTIKNNSGVKLYDDYPYAVDFEINMINYNFNLEVGLDLPKFDVFTSENFGKIVYSSYDQNIHGTTMPMKCPKLKMTYTIHDNGQVCMCVSQKDVTKALINIDKGHKMFYLLLDAMRECNK